MDVAAYYANLQKRHRQREEEREVIRRRVATLARSAAQVVLPAFPQVRRAYLFGSVTRPGALRRSSDVDVAVEGDLDADFADKRR